MKIKLQAKLDDDARIADVPMFVGAHIMKDSVELQIEAKRLVIEVVKQPHASWFDDYRNEHDEAALETIPVE